MRAMRVLAFLLSLFLTLPAGGVRGTLTAEKSGLLSPEALKGLQALLAEAALTVSAEGCDLTLGDDLLLAARPGMLRSGEAAAALEQAPAPDIAALWALLEPRKAEKNETVDLNEAGKAASQWIYALPGEDWDALRAELASILGLPELAASRVPGKATFKRYFDRAGREIGAYFYTAQIEWNGMAREVRLEYGYQPQKGLYLAFRCPDEGQTDNLRLSLHGKRADAGWRLEGELRRVTPEETTVYAVKGKTDGKLTLTRSGAGSLRLTLARTADGADYRLERGDTLLLAGRASWEAAELPAREMGDSGDVNAALDKILARHLRAAAPEGWQQMLHYLATDALLSAGQKEE